MIALRRANPSLPFRRLSSGAIDVGQDHIAATVKTLVFGYAGRLIGSIGLIASMPITTALAALLALKLPDRALEARTRTRIKRPSSDLRPAAAGATIAAARPVPGPTYRLEDLDRLHKLQAVTEAALAHLSLEDLLEELLVRIRDALESDTAAILLLDEATNELVARAAKGIEEEVEQGVRLPLGRGFAGRVAAERRPVILEDVDHADVLNPILRQKGIKSMLGVPLLTDGRVLGVLHVGTLVHRTFTNDDVELLSIVADRAARAISGVLVHEALIRLEALERQFIALASHELRTPATAIFGISTTLQHRGDSLSPDQKAELLDTLHAQAERMRALVTQLLDLSRLQADAQPLNVQRVAVRPHLEEIVRVVAGNAEDVVVDAPSDLEIDVDPAALERIVANLVTNAIRYGAPPFAVGARASDEHARIVVEDAGPGVAAEFRPHLFDRFSRANDSDTVGGSGLGLAIARSYAQAHGGDVVYEDVVPRGARFAVILPRRIQA